VKEEKSVGIASEKDMAMQESCFGSVVSTGIDEVGFD
jgi:hypothetical protein